MATAILTAEQKKKYQPIIDGKTILVTGGTGSFGKKFVRMTLENFNPKKLIVFSRDEMKQWEMREAFESIDKRGVLRYFLGDVRDKERIHRAFQNVDYVIHAAASKIVPLAEYNPFECIKTNIHGSMNVIECAIEQKVQRIVALSTDKACNPINLYGATKLCADKLFVAGNAYTGNQDTRFSVVRYGNVMGSRGSIIPFFRTIPAGEEVPITDERMTRFMITLERGVELVWQALAECIGGEILVPKIPSMKVTDIARVVAPKSPLKTVGIRPGEKIHEYMISLEDSRTTYEYDNYYKILPPIHDWHNCEQRIASGRKCAEGFVYASDSNPEWMQPAELQNWMAHEYREETVSL